MQAGDQVAALPKRGALSDFNWDGKRAWVVGSPYIGSMERASYGIKQMCVNCKDSNGRVFRMAVEDLIVTVGAYDELQEGSE